MSLQRLLAAEGLMAVLDRLRPVLLARGLPAYRHIGGKRAFIGKIHSGPGWLGSGVGPQTGVAILDELELGSCVEEPGIPVHPLEGPPKVGGGFPGETHSAEIGAADGL